MYERATNELIMTMAAILRPSGGLLRTHLGMIEYKCMHIYCDRDSIRIYHLGNERMYVISYADPDLIPKILMLQPGKGDTNENRPPIHLPATPSQGLDAA